MAKRWVKSRFVFHVSHDAANGIIRHASSAEALHHRLYDALFAGKGISVRSKWTRVLDKVRIALLYGRLRGAGLVSG